MVRLLAVVFGIALILFPVRCLAVSQSVPLSAGFNFIAPTVDPAPAVSADDLLTARADLVSVFRFDAASQSFQFRLRLPDGGLFGDTFNLAGGLGCVLNASTEVTLELNGEPYTGDPLAGAVEGFNFVGMPVRTGQGARTLLGDLPRARSVFGWNRTTASFRFNLRLDNGGLFGDDFNLEAGQGYFVNWWAQGPQGLASLTADPAEFRVSAGGNLDLTQVKLTAAWADATTSEITTEPTWSVVLGSGSVSGTTYTAPATGGFALLRATLTVDGVTRVTDITVAVVEQQTATITGTTGGTVSLARGISFTIPPGGATGAVETSLAEVGFESNGVTDDQASLRLKTVGTVNQATLRIPQPADGAADYVAVAVEDSSTGAFTFLQGTLETSTGDFLVPLASLASPAPSPAVPAPNRALTDSDLGTKIVVEYARTKTTATIPSEVLIPMPYFEQDGDNCWAAVCLMFCHGYRPSPEKFNSIYSILNAMGVGKNEGIDSIRLWGNLINTQLTSLSTRLSGRTCEYHRFITYQCMLSYILNTLARGIPLQVNMINHQGLFVGYKLAADSTQNAPKVEYFIYHDPTIGLVERTGFNRGPYTRITTEQIIQNFASVTGVKNPGETWWQWWSRMVEIDPRILNGGSVVHADQAPVGVPLQTIHLSDGRDAFASGLGFLRVIPATGQEAASGWMVWNHLATGGIESNVPEIPNIHKVELKGIPLFNMAESATDLDVRTRIWQFKADGTPISATPMLEKRETVTLPAKNSTDYKLVFSTEDWFRDLNDQAQKFKVIGELMSGSEVMNGFQVYFTYRPFRVDPPVLQVLPGKTGQFNALLQGEKVTGTWKVFQADGGSIDGNGLYTAPLTEGTYDVEIKRVDTLTRYAYGKAVVKNISISPQQAHIGRLHSQQFEIIPVRDVTWSLVGVTGGSAVTSAGLFTPGTDSGTYTVRAQSDVEPVLDLTAEVKVGGIFFAPSIITVMAQRSYDYDISVTNPPPGAVFDFDFGDTVENILGTTATRVYHTYQREGTFPLKATMKSATGAVWDVALATVTVEPGVELKTYTSWWDVDQTIKKVEYTYYNRSSDGWEVKHGPWKSWYENGTLYQEAEFSDGKHIGVDKMYEMTGGKLTKETGWAEGKMQRETWFTVETGEKWREILYSSTGWDETEWDTVLNRILRTVATNIPPLVADYPSEHWVKYENGARVAEGDLYIYNYTERKFQGPWQFWYTNGQLSARGSYQAGYEKYVDGFWEFWYDTGVMKQKVEYRGGVVVGNITWNVGGSITSSSGTLAQ